jgi:hypothetical protein
MDVVIALVFGLKAKIISKSDMVAICCEDFSNKTITLNREFLGNCCYKRTLGKVFFFRLSFFRTSFKQGQFIYIKKVKIYSLQHRIL